MYIYLYMCVCKKKCEWRKGLCIQLKGHNKKCCNCDSYIRGNALQGETERDGERETERRCKCNRHFLCSSWYSTCSVCNTKNRWNLLCVSKIKCERRTEQSEKHREMCVRDTCDERNRRWIISQSLTLHSIFNVLLLFSHSLSLLALVSINYFLHCE